MRARLQELGWGLREFCRETEVDPSFFSKVLSGKRSPPSEESVLRRIAKALELDAPSLIVASGRIPSEWRSLWEDPAVFTAVNRIAAGKSFPASKPFSSAPVSERKSREEAAVRKPAKSFGEELL